MKILPILNSVFILFLAVFLGLNFFQDRHYSKAIIQKVEENNTNSCATFDSMESEIDSVNIKLERLAEASMYLDSCQQIRTNKSERAERRGKFVGGLLKALFPSL